MQTSAGQTLRAWRKAQRMTQADLGRRIGVQQATVSEYEGGTRVPSAKRAQKIERVTKGGVPATVWLADDETAPTAAE